MDILEELDTLRLGPSEYKIVQKAYTEIEQLREALKDIDGQMRQADRYFLKESTLAALQQKDTE